MSHEQLSPPTSEPQEAPNISLENVGKFDLGYSYTEQDPDIEAAHRVAEDLTSAKAPNTESVDSTKEPVDEPASSPTTFT